MPELRRIRCRTSYDGTTFHGWQVQPGLPTIQAELQRVLSEIEETPVIVEASGRTDAATTATRERAEELGGRNFQGVMTAIGG